MEPLTAFYPVSLDVGGRPCLVVGGGPVAARKAAGLKVGQAKAELEAEAAEARQTIHAAAGELAERVVRAILPLAAGGSR